jgi:serine/threonine protein kinase
MKTCPTCQGSYPRDYTMCPQDGSPLRDVGIWAEGNVIRGKYRILSKVGQGGMGTVYKAVHLAFDELRALKVIAPELLHDELFVRRFKQEAVITRKLQHPNAVRVDDIDEAEDGRPFIVMEFIQGKSPKKVIQEEGPLPVPRVCSIVKQVAAALDAAHGLGMVHRDIKPDNIALIESREGERVKVLDFGIAKMKEARLGAASGMTLTGTGVVVGTPQYMSPEQAKGKRGDELDGRSDLYSLGVVMYEMLTGDLPFQAETTMGMLMARLQEPPRPILTLRPELQIPAPMASLTMRLLEKDPDRRPANARALIEEVEAAERGIAPLGPTRAVQASEPVSPEQIRAAAKAAPSVTGRDQAMDVSSLIPTSRPPVQPQSFTAGAPVPAVTPTPVGNLESGILNPPARTPGPAVAPAPVGNLESGILNPPARASAPAVAPTPVGNLESGILNPPARTPGPGIAPAPVWNLESGILNPPARTPGPSVAPAPVLNLESGILNPAARTPAAVPTPQPETQSRWGIWVGIAILLVGLGAGGWYISYRHSSSLGTAPVSPPSAQGAGTSQPTPSQPPASQQSPRIPESAQGETGGGQGIQPESVPTASEAPTSSVNVAPTGAAASAVDPKKIKGAITLGDFYFKDGKYADAIKAYQEGLKLDPANPDLLERVQRAKKAKAAEEKILH